MFQFTNVLHLSVSYPRVYHTQEEENTDKDWLKHQGVNRVVSHRKELRILLLLEGELELPGKRN